MNTTVARIVEIMFQDYELTDELLTIKDEVMSNCQERYQDCIQRGLTEDEAIGAVIESLKGMEEVLANIPKRTDARRDSQQEPDEAEAAEAENNLRLLTWEASALDSICTNLIGDDVIIKASPDNQIHLELNNVPHVQARVEGRCLKIERDKNYVEVHQGSRKNRARTQTKVQIGDKTYVEINDGHADINYNSFSEMMKSIKQMVQQVQHGLSSIVTINGRVVLQLPEDTAYGLDLHSTSGDIKVDSVTLSMLRCQTISGDINIDLPDGDTLPEAKLVTSSGDLNAMLNAQMLFVNTVSGDLHVEGDIDTLQAHTTSGDLELEGNLHSITANTVSGDLTVTPSCATPMTVTLKSTSGDLHFYAPDDATVTAHLRSVSGDVCNNCRSDGERSLIQIQAQTVSGDIQINE